MFISKTGQRVRSQSQIHLRYWKVFRFTSIFSLTNLPVHVKLIIWGEDVKREVKTLLENILLIRLILSPQHNCFQNQTDVLWKLIIIIMSFYSNNLTKKYWTQNTCDGRSSTSLRYLSVWPELARVGHFVVLLGLYSVFYYNCLYLSVLLCSCWKYRSALSYSGCALFRIW